MYTPFIYVYIVHMNDNQERRKETQALITLCDCIPYTVVFKTASVLCNAVIETCLL